MDASHLTELMFQPLSPTVVSLFDGIAFAVPIGLAHFLSLNWVAGLFINGGIFLAVALQLARILLLCAALLFLAKLGAVPLLAGTGSLLLARSAIFRLQWSAG